MLALDLGRLQILSAIGEPLRAEIEIAQASQDELRSLRAQLASPARFQQAGLEFNPALKGVTASLQSRNNGAAFIALGGKAPIQENFIDLILETQSSTGQLVKHYALLLDSVNDRSNRTTSSATSVSTRPVPVEPRASVRSNPPPISATMADAARSVQPTHVELNAQNVPVYRFAPVDTPPVAAPAPVTITTAKEPLIGADNNARVPRVASTLSEKEGIKVKAGETASLWAMRHLAADVSLDQMLLAMLKANPEAFIEGNVNLLKAGAILRIPTADEATQIPRSEARQTVLAQSRDFAEYARRLATSPLVVGTPNSREISGKVTTETPNVEATSSQQDKLTLSKSQIRTDSTEAKLAVQLEAQNAVEQLEALKKTQQDLEALAKGLSIPQSSAPALSTAVQAPVSAPIVNANLAKIEAAQPNAPSELLKAIGEDQKTWVWGAGLLALLFTVGYKVLAKSRKPEEVYAPSYSDVAAQVFEPTSDHSQRPMDMAAKMSSIDLNLPTQSPSTAMTSQAASPTPQPSPVTAISQDTEQSKLTLASELLAQGDQNLARTLILSVASSATGDLKSRALHMLGQLR